MTAYFTHALCACVKYAKSPRSSVDRALVSEAMCTGSIPVEGAWMRRVLRPARCRLCRIRGRTRWASKTTRRRCVGFYNAAMKKTIVWVIVAGLATVACKEKEEPKKKASHAAVVVFVVGKDVKIVSAKGQTAAAKGAVLYETDKIVTGKKSQVDLVLPNNILIRIDQNTTIEMKEFAVGEGGAQRDRLMLQKGTVFAKVAKLDKKSSFAIQTPTLVAGVRGTQFMTEADESGKGKVAVIEGKVGVESSTTGKTEEITEGEQAEVSSTGDIVENKIDEATAAKTSALATVANIKETELQKFQNLLGDQQKLLDQSSGREKIDSMKQDTEKRIQEEKDKATGKIEGLKGQTDSKIQEMKASTEGKVQQNTEKIDAMKGGTQQKIDAMKGNSVDEMKKKQEEMLKKLP
jgi:hypothetical protein